MMPDKMGYIYDNMCKGWQNPPVQEIIQKFYGTGVVDGVTGVFTKPVSGAKEEGVDGFFKGLGKGAVGLVARPAAGVIDFASGSFDVVKRMTELSEETCRQRSPRLIATDTLVRPYSSRDSEGLKFLNELEKGKFFNTDTYVYHVAIVENKEVLLLTDKRIAYIMPDIFGGWQISWSYIWQELHLPAKVVPKGVAIPTPEGKKKLLGVFGSSEVLKVVLISDPVLQEQVCSKIEELRKST